MRTGSPLPLLMLALRLLAVPLMLAFTGCLKTSAAKPPEPSSLSALEVQTAAGAPLPADTLDVGTIIAGMTAKKTARLHNPNAGAVTVSVAITAGTPFSVRASSSEIPGLGDGAFEVVYAPEFEQEVALASVEFDIAGGPSTQVVLKGSSVSLRCIEVIGVGALDFRSVTVGSSFEYALPIVNPTRYPWTFTVNFPDGPDASAFSLDEDIAEREIEMPPSGQVLVPVRFSPRRLGAYTASVTVRLPGRCATQAVALRGVGAQRVVECVQDPASTEADCAVDFGYVAAAGERVVRSIAFHTLGPSDDHLTLGELVQPAGKGSPFALTSATRDYTLSEGGAPTSIEVEFVPSVAGAQEATLALTSSDPGFASGTIRLHAHAGGPRAQLSATSLSFATDAVGMTLSRALSITNASDFDDGTADDNLSFATLSDGEWTPAPPQILGSSDFSVEWPPADFPTATGLPAGSSGTLRVRYTPTAAGPRTATLRLFVNEREGIVLDVPLEGTALALPPCNLSIAPTTVHFGTVPPQTSRTLALRLANTATAAADGCIVSVAPPTGAGFALPDGPIDAALIPGGESLVVPVQLRATATIGALSSALSITLSNPAQPTASIPLDATIASTNLTFSEVPVDFGPYEPTCHSPEHVVTLWNTSSSTERITSITLAPGSSPAFTLTQVPSMPLVIAPGATSTIGLTFAPASVGQDNATIVIASTTTPAGYALPVIGTGSTAGTRTEIFALPAQTKRDVLLILDDSGSDDVSNLVLAHLTDFLSVAVSDSVDYHLAATTVSLDGPSYPCGRFVPVTGTATRILTPSTPNLATAAAAIFNVGHSGTGTESLIRPAYLALSAPLVTGTNAGFLRADADLRVLVCSDAVDQDPLATPVTFYRDFLWSLKGRNRRDRVSVSGFIATLPAGPPWSSGCSYDSSDAGQDPRVKSLIADTAGRAIEYCDVGTNLSLIQQMSAVLFGPQLTYFLNGPPDPALATASTTVEIDGISIAAVGPRGDRRWTYDAPKQAIVFEKLAAPTAGSTVSITYPVACL